MRLVSEVIASIGQTLTERSDALRYLADLARCTVSRALTTDSR